MKRAISTAARVCAALIIATTSASGEEPCSTDWLSENPCELTEEEREELQKFTDETIAVDTTLSRFELRNRSAELILVESPRVADGYWQAIVTITNKTPSLLEAANYVDCVLFDQRGSRVAISTAVRPDVDLGPGESFSDEALAEVPIGAIIARHDCRFRL